MESLTLFLFVLGLLLAALVVTQTIRRELKDRERLDSDLRRDTMHVRPDTSARAHGVMREQPAHQHAHKSSRNAL